MINNQQCVRCINDKTVRGIAFNEEGLCSHCTAYDQYRPVLSDRAYLEDLFQKRLSIPGNYDYDVAMGFSGGKDSAYVLYKLVKEHKLKVKAYTLDNGFMSGEAKEKINRLVKEIGVEHEYVVYDDTLLKAAYKRIVSKYLSPCIACSLLGYTAMINYASRVNARVGIHGRSTYQMFRGLSDSSTDIFRPLLDAGLRPEPPDLEALYGQLLAQMESRVDKTLARDIKNVLLADAQKSGYRDFLAYFLYHPYDHRQVVSFLEEHTSWKPEKESEHFDCRIHHGALYLKNMVARRSHLMPEYSVMINEGILTKEEALLKMEDAVDPETARKELKALCDYANINYHTTMLKAKIYAKRWW